MATPIQDLPGEIWKPVVGWENRYLVSNKGRVMALPRPIQTPRHIALTGRAQTRARVMRASCGPLGHQTVTLNDADSGRVNFSSGVHRLVYEAFVGPIPDGLDICHNDGDATNNDPANLRADTRAGNILDTARHGTKPRKLSDDDVAAIRALAKRGISCARIARDFRVTRQAVYQVIARISYGWL